MDVYWFSNRCPFFSVYHAELFNLKKAGETITTKNLGDLGFQKAALWLQSHQESWDRFFNKRVEEIERIQNHGGGVVFWSDSHYPSRLRKIFYPPSILFYKGDMSILEGSTVAVVGARQATHLGREWVKKNIPELCRSSYAIVSGGARGIDGEAHSSAIKNNGKTVAYLPGSLLNPYPRSHDYLFEQIVSAGGLIVSEYSFTDSVRCENFHRRNRLISGSSQAVIIVEAKLKSGTLMTANKAISENIDVLVVPGSPFIENYSGSLELIYHGSTMIRDANDALFSLEKRNALKKTSESPNLNLI